MRPPSGVRRLVDAPRRSDLPRRSPFPHTSRPSRSASRAATRRRLAAEASTAASTSSPSRPGRPSAAWATRPRRPRPSRTAAPSPSTTAPVPANGRCAALELALDLGAGDDVVLAGVVPADPGLVATVVVGRPEDEGGVAIPDAAGVVTLGIESAPDADEGI